MLFLYACYASYSSMLAMQVIPLCLLCKLFLYACSFFLDCDQRTILGEQPVKRNGFARDVPGLILT